MVAADAVWTGSVSSDLNIDANWSPATVPDGRAIFNSDSSLNFNPSATFPFTIDELVFSNDADEFSFTFMTPILGFLEITGAGITGATNQAPSIRFNNTSLLAVPQLFFNTGSRSVSSSIGNADITLFSGDGAGISSANTDSAAQLAFGDSQRGDTGKVFLSSGLRINAMSHGDISSGKNATQLLIRNISVDGSGANNVEISATNNKTIQIFNTNEGGSVGQLLIIANPGETASMTLGDHATFDLLNSQTAEICHSSSSINLLGQIGILTQLSGGTASSSLSVGNQANFSIENQGLIKIEDFSYSLGQFSVCAGVDNQIATFDSGDYTHFTLLNKGTMSTVVGWATAQYIIGNGFDDSTVTNHIGNHAQFDVTNEGVIIGEYDGAQMLLGAGSITLFNVGDHASFNLNNTTDGQINSNSAHSGQIIIDSYYETSFQAGNSTSMDIVNNGAITGMQDAAQLAITALEIRTTDPRLEVGDNSSINLTNQGSITAGSGQLAGQFVADGRMISPNNILVRMGNNTKITATNGIEGTITTSGGMDPVAQMYFHNSIIEGSPILTAINQQTAPNIDGMIFSGTSRCDNSHIALGNSSFVVETSSPLTIASLTGDDQSVVKLNGSDLIINTSSEVDTVFSGLCTGTGNMTIDGSGHQTLSKVSISGMVTKRGTGTLTFDDISSFPGVLVVNDGEIDVLSGSTTFAAGDILLDGGGARFNDTRTITREISILPGGGSLFVAPDHLVTLNGAVIGSPGGGPFAKIGSGSLNLVAPTTYDGDLTVNDGNLFVNTTFPGNITVENGAILKGEGNIENTGLTNNVVIRSGGTGSAGNSVGTITIANYTFLSGANYAVEINPTNSTLTNVTNTLDIQPLVQDIFQCPPI